MEPSFPFLLQQTFVKSHYVQDTAVCQKPAKQPRAAQGGAQAGTPGGEDLPRGLVGCCFPEGGFENSPDKGSCLPSGTNPGSLSAGAAVPAGEPESHSLPWGSRAREPCTWLGGSERPVSSQERKRSIRVPSSRVDQRPQEGAEGGRRGSERSPAPGRLRVNRTSLQPLLRPCKGVLVAAGEEQRGWGPLGAPLLKIPPGKPGSLAAAPASSEEARLPRR